MYGVLTDRCKVSKSYLFELFNFFCSYLKVIASKQDVIINVQVKVILIGH